MLGSGEVALLALLVLILFGADALRDLARIAGKVKRELRKLEREVFEDARG